MNFHDHWDDSRNSSQRFFEETMRILPKIELFIIQNNNIVRINFKIQ
jgi:hypothetical protein